GSAHNTAIIGRGEVGSGSGRRECFTFASTDILDHASSFYMADRERQATWLRLHVGWLVRIASSNRSSEEVATRDSRSQGTWRTCMRSSTSTQNAAILSY